MSWKVKRHIYSNTKSSINLEKLLDCECVVCEKETVIYANKASRDEYYRCMHILEEAGAIKLDRMPSKDAIQYLLDGNVIYSSFDYDICFGSYAIDICWRGGIERVRINVLYCVDE